ncbi:MAG: MoaD/ThiS family protein [Deltaproteobacteria bacterium]|nr:MoaD/ThiS family protein [Deltaproteobacteria bacterium]
MKLNVKLYGTFKNRFPHYETSTGMEMEVPPGTLVKHLLARLKIGENQGGVVVLNGRILRMEDEIPLGGEVQIFQAIGGG